MAVQVCVISSGVCVQRKITKNCKTTWRKWQLPINKFKSLHISRNKQHHIYEMNDHKLDQVKDFCQFSELRAYMVVILQLFPDDAETIITTVMTVGYLAVGCRWRYKGYCNWYLKGNLQGLAYRIAPQPKSLWYGWEHPRYHGIFLQEHSMKLFLVANLHLFNHQCWSSSGLPA